MIFKPDCMEKKLLPKVLERFFNAGLDIAACKMLRMTDALLNEHYAHIAGEPFYPPILDFMKRRPVVAAVLEGEDAVAKVRKLIGPTNSQKAPAGTVRGDFGDGSRENIVHASDCVENAGIEIARFFRAEEVF